MKLKLVAKMVWYLSWRLQ